MKKLILLLLISISSISQQYEIDNNFKAQPFSRVFDGYVSDIFQVNDNDLLIAGEFNIVNGEPIGFKSDYYKFNLKGELDKSFRISKEGFSYKPIKVLKNGKIIWSETEKSSGNATFLKMNPNLTIDNSFRIGGGYYGSEYVFEMLDNNLLLGKYGYELGKKGSLALVNESGQVLKPFDGIDKVIQATSFNDKNVIFKEFYIDDKMVIYNTDSKFDNFKEIRAYYDIHRHFIKIIKIIGKYSLNRHTYRGSINYVALDLETGKSVYLDQFYHKKVFATNDNFMFEIYDEKNKLRSEIPTQ